MGLTHRDFASWEAAHERRGPLPRLRRRRPRTALLARGGPDPDVLVAVDNAGRTSRASLVAALLRLPADRVAVLLPEDCRALLPGNHWSWQPWGEGEPLPPTPVTLLGTELDLGGHALRGRRTRPVVLQHGILTPDTPPLPTGAHLLAWHAPDLGYWTDGRDDVSGEVVGSQLLAEARADGAPPADGPLTFLGQLHGSELPRASLARAAEEFCLATGAEYRPHPAEVDRLSRATHRRWERRGIVLDRSGSPLLASGRPVASVYSTGVLEAAAAGLPAWVSHPDPPAWLVALWDRYALARWGSTTPTRPPDGLVPPEEPAALAAAALLRLADDAGRSRDDG